MGSGAKNEHAYSFTQDNYSMWNGTRDVSEQMRHNSSNYENGNPFGNTTETRYRPDSGTPGQKGGLDKGQLDYFDDPKRGQHVQFPRDKLQATDAKRVAQVTREEIEQMKDDIAELLDFKDKGMQATPFRLMEQVTSLQKSVNELRCEVHVAETVQHKINLVLPVIDTFNRIEDEVGKLYQTKEELHSLLHKYQKDYKKIYSVAEQAEEIWTSIERLETWVGTMRLVIDGGNMLRKKNTERIESLEKRLSNEKEKIEPRLKPEALESRLQALETNYTRLYYALKETEESHKVSRSLIIKTTRKNEELQGDISNLYKKHKTLHLQRENESNGASSLRTLLNRLSGIEKRLDLLEGKIK